MEFLARTETSTGKGAKRFDAALLARLLLVGLGAAALVYSWVFVWRYFTSPLWADLWLWPPDFQKWVNGQFTLHDLIKPHVQHRIATTRLLLLIDSIYFGMSGDFVAVCNVVALLILGVLLWRLAMNGVARQSAWYVPAAVWAGFVAGTCQVQNLIIAFQVQFALMCCCVVAAAWLFASACDDGLTRAGAVIRAVAGGIFWLIALFTLGGFILLLPALGALLVLRRAPRVVWAVFGVCAVTVVALDEASTFFGHEAKSALSVTAYMAPTMALLGLRAMFSALFLASFMSALPGAAPWVGFAAFGVLLGLGGPPVWRRLRGGAACQTEDATLLAVAAFAALCALAASMTDRVMFGAGAALVTRYATMSLLFWAACAALLLRRLDDAWPHAKWPRVPVVMAVAGLLALVNLPHYVEFADDHQRRIAASDGMLVNNIALDGPIPHVVFGGVTDINDAVTFIHGAGLNIFRPGQGPPADLVAQLSAAPIGSLPACRGSIEWATALDSGAVLIDGWIADPDGRHTAPWVAVRNEQGKIVGTAASLKPRAELGPDKGFKPPSYGFESGFRDGADGLRRLQLAGIFPDRTTKLCELRQKAEISGLLVQPIVQLRGLRVAPLVAAAEIKSGFAGGMGVAPGGAAFVPAAPVFSAGGGADHEGEVDFAVGTGAPAEMNLVVPFWAAPEANGKTVTFVLGDGARIETPLASWWAAPSWRAAVLPAALARLHGGAVRVEVRDAGGGALTVAAPMLATERPGWSRLF